MAALTLQAEAYAFRQLVAHLQWRTDVQNIELMNLAGFCRNCLSKWYHAGTKVYGMPLEYDEACERVYGEPYSQWKKRHQGKASEEQMAAFQASQTKHARTDPGPPVAPSIAAQGGHSNVCGMDCDGVAAPEVLESGGPVVQARVAVLTASDRASSGAYADESGPAVVDALQAFAARSGGTLVPSFTRKAVVPDDEEGIYKVLKNWSDTRENNLIITTGGTGLGPRDVTPEATGRLLVRPAETLARAMAWQTSLVEPHSILSRGVCGVTETGALIVNLPGHPSAVKQCLSVLLPVLPRALQMLGT